MKGQRNSFHSLHQAGCFTMPNVWDAGTAKILESFGFPAIATTSSGLAYRFGVKDAAANLRLASALENVSEISSAVGVPVNADFENGYADAPEDVAENVRLCAEAGAAGCTLEDWDGSAFYPLTLAVERVAAAVEAAESSGNDFVVTARAEHLLHIGREAIDEVFDRLERFAAAGAHCLYAPGMRDADDIRRLVEMSSTPVNVLVGIPGMNARAAEMQALGVRRLSVGGSLARTALTAVVEAAAEMADGRFDFPDSMVSDAELQRRFARGSSSDEDL